MGRKKINCSLGEKRPHTFWLYPVEFERLRIEFNKLKSQRKKYYKEVANETSK